jgi:hypothetical protein
MQSGVLNTIYYSNNLETAKEIVWVFPGIGYTAFVPMAREIVMDK